MQKQNSLLSKKRLSSGSIKEKKLRKKSSKQFKVKGPWTEKEDKLLNEWVEKNGAKNWARCAETIKGRNGKQCREHWNNSLNQNIKKGEWSSEEDLYIMVFYNKLNKSWKKMIPLFKSRTENAIKNRFYSQLRKITAKYIHKDKREYNTKFKLGTLIKYYGEGVEEAKKDFLKDHPLTDNDYNLYIKDVEDLVNNKPNNQEFIDLDDVRKKYFTNLMNENNTTINNGDANNNIIINKDNNSNNNDNNSNIKEEEKINNINIQENKNEDNNNGEKEDNNNDEKEDNNNDENEDDIDNNSISGDEESEKGSLEINIDNKEKNNQEGQNKYLSQNINTGKNNTFDRTYYPNTFYYNNNLTNNPSDVKSKISMDKTGNYTPNKININVGCNINIINNNNNFLNNNNMNNMKGNYLYNHNPSSDINPNNVLNDNKIPDISYPIQTKPSGINDYKNNILSLPIMHSKNNLNSVDKSWDTPIFRNNYNSNIDNMTTQNTYLNYYYPYSNNNNAFKPMYNNNGDYYGYNREMSTNINYPFKHYDSNELNKNNKLNSLLPPFGYQRLPSFGSNNDNKIYDYNNNNFDNNK